MDLTHAVCSPGITENASRSPSLRKTHTAPDQIVVPLAGGHLVVDDLQPLGKRLPDGDVRARVPLGMHLALQPDELDLRLGIRRAGLAEPAVLAGQVSGSRPA